MLGPPESHPTYSADAVFVGLAGDILRGELAPDSPLPAERLLAARFQTSRILVRQAVHRLAELGLVRARQGAVARVCDPHDVADVRVIELFYRLAPDSAAARDLARDVLEKQHTQGLSLIEVFERRASAPAREALVLLTANADAKDEDAFAAFERAFWTLIATEGKNRILQAEVRFWYGALPPRPTAVKAPLADRRAFYRALAAHLRDRKDALGYYVTKLRPGLDALFAPKPPKARPRAKGKRS